MTEHTYGNTPVTAPEPVREPDPPSAREPAPGQEPGTDRPAPGAAGSAPRVGGSAPGTDRPASGAAGSAPGTDRPASGAARSAPGTDRPASGAARSAPGTGRPARGPLARAAAAFARRWPTWLAIAVAAVLVSDLGDGSEFSVILPLLAAGYLTVTVIGRPGLTWSVIIAFTAVVVLTRMIGVDPRPVLIAAAFLAAAAGLANGRLRGTGLRAAQLPVALGCVAVALGAAYLSPDLGLFLMAAGLLGHGVGDAFLWRDGRVVARSLAEWCVVFDVIVGTAGLWAALR
ncbi:hypothetical protein ACFYSC_06695 [Streptosporangium sp. NPDC004379]|uniref:hypothetical protein n=1 Tax=Streptosporangium sp. NPDC004379 TaxID=3366189 RepID=UPI0036B658E1